MSGPWELELYDCKLPDVGAGIRTLVLCKGSACSYSLSHLSNPQHIGFQKRDLGPGRQLS